MNKKYIVRLTDTERGVLEGLVNTGKGAAHTLTHARILLKADCGPDGPAWTDPMISTALDVSIPTIERVRRMLLLPSDLLARTVEVLRDVTSTPPRLS